jgi:hypothetical protein
MTRGQHPSGPQLGQKRRGQRLSKNLVRANEVLQVRSLNIHWFLSNSFTLVVAYCSKPGQFWPDGEELPSKGQKSRKRVFVTKGKFETRKEITRDNNEIRRLKDNDRSTQTFHPKSGDIELYHDYSDYDGTDEEDLFDTDDEHLTPSPVVAPVPPRVTVNVPVGSWVDRDDQLDPDDLDVLSEVMYIPEMVYKMLLPPSDDITVQEILEFKVPDIDVDRFTETGASYFSRARPKEDLDLTMNIPPKTWVGSLRESLHSAIRSGMRSIIHPGYKDHPLPLWMLTLWEKLHTVREAKATWADASTWLTDMCRTSGKFCRSSPTMSFDLAYRLMSRLPYYKKLVMPASGGIRRTLHLAGLLSDDAWLTSTLVDLMIKTIVERLGPAHADFVITNTEFADAIYVAKQESEPSSYTFRSLEETLSKGKILFFPAYIPDARHYIAFRIDFGNKTFCYGM